MLRLVAMLGIVLLIAGHTARAQDVVRDYDTEDNTSSISKDTSAIAKSSASTLQAVTQPTNVTSMFADQDTASTLNPMPTTTQVISNISYKTPQATSTGQTIYDNNNTDVSGTDPEATDLKNTITTSSNIEGMALDNLTALQSRLSELDEMKQQLSSASSIMAVAAINGRIAVEALAVQAQQAQAANLDALAIAQNELNTTNREQAIRQEHQNTISLFTIGSIGSLIP